ncbi:MAG: Gfo/Idh/MocA family oxidoreductase [Rhodospirillales bacterium]
MRVAVIGVGAMGANHARVYSEIPNVTLVGISDNDQDTSDRTGKRLNVPSYADYRTLLDTERPEAVSVAVPTSLHFEVVSACVERGIHVLVEKPLAMNVDEGRRLIDAANKMNVCLGVGHIERFNPVVKALKEKLEQKEIGRIFQITAQRLGPQPSRIKDVGVLLDMATHDIDLFYHLIDDEIMRASVEKAECIGRPNEDIATAMFRFNNGVIGVILENWLSPTKVREITVNGEGGMYVANLLTQDLFFHMNAAAQVSRVDDLSPVMSIGNTIRYNIVHAEPLRLELVAFIEAASEGKPFLIDGEAGLRTLEMAIRLRDS